MFFLRFIHNETAILVTHYPNTRSNMTSIESKIGLFRKWLSEAGLSEKEHQISAMEFCLKRETAEEADACRGGVLADEMGLGKTVVMFGCIVSNFVGKTGRHNTLIVLPPAILYQWCDIIERFMGHTPLVYHGYKAKKITKSQLESAPIVVTTYGMISENSGTTRLIWSVKWNRLIADEAHHFRNMDSRVFKGMKKIDADIRWMVTGTPIQNKTSDIYALFSVLGLEPKFYRSMATIKETIEKHVLRRTKDSVGIQLPNLRREVIVVPWASAEEKRIALRIHSRVSFQTMSLGDPQAYADEIDTIGADPLIEALTGSGKVLPGMIRARQCCILPSLLHKPIRKMKSNGSIPAERNIDNVKTTSKMTAIIKHIQDRQTNGRRKIMFCHYREEIDHVSKELTKLGIVNRCIDGRSDKESRLIAFDPNPPITEQTFRSVCRKWAAEGEWMFRNISEWFCVHQVLIVQIQTASEGLNLQHFQEIYFTSIHWNPTVEEQAIARSHRIGQTEEVEVFRFVMENFAPDSCSIDNYCMYVQESKRRLQEILG